MGRPSIAEERIEQILDGFERCIVQFGLAGSSLERIAKEANVKRSILRHYVGNREDLINALIDRVTRRYTEYIEFMFSGYESYSAEEKILAVLFPEQSYGSMDSVIIVEALIALADKDERCRRLMFDYIEAFVGEVTRVLCLDYPSAGEQRCWDIAYSIVSFNFNQESLVSLKLPDKYVCALRTSTRFLIRSLSMEESTQSAHHQMNV